MRVLKGGKGIQYPLGMGQGGEVVDSLKLPSNAIIKCKELGCETECITLLLYLWLISTTEMALCSLRGIWVSEREVTALMMMSYFLI